MSLEVTSRADRAFSRAADTESTIEHSPGSPRPNATRSVRAHMSSAVPGGLMPSTPSSTREVWSGSALESSSSW